MSHAEAFHIGTLPALAGVYFNADELLARLQPAPPELRPALLELKQKVDARARETIEMVLECERWMRSRGRPSAGRPRTPEDYRRWAQAMVAAGQQELGGTVAAGAARLLGLQLGDLCLTLALAGLVADLRRAAPDHELLRRQAEALAGDEARARSSLALAARSVGLPDAVGELVAPAATDGDFDRLLALRAEIESALGD